MLKQTIKKSVEGKIDDITDKTIIGYFQKEQKKFIEEQLTKKISCKYPDRLIVMMKKQFNNKFWPYQLDKSNSLLDPPAAVQFHFDLDQTYSVAAVMLQEDKLLSRMRFALAPNLVKEEVFWRNCCYHVS